MNEGSSAGVRQGILRVANTVYGEAQVRRVLPAEHVIRAIRALPLIEATDYLIEGPMLPIVDGPIPEVTISLSLTMQIIADGPGVRLISAWGHASEHTWTVGEWSSFEAFCDELDFIKR